MDYKKPQSTLVKGGTGIYPLTTADQVILADGSRLEKDGRISADSAANSADSAKLGGKAPEYYLQPRNLLDNSDFTNPVNQRKSSEYMFDFGYSLDRWRLCGGDGISRVRVLSGCIELSLNDGKSYFDQLIDIDNTKTYTFAVLTDDGLHVISGIPSVGANDGVILLGINSAGYVKASVVGFLRAYNIYWAALYEGTYTADTLPPYVPKGYAAELAECLRYYYKTPAQYAITPYYFSTTERYYSILLPAKMRIAPTVTYTDQDGEYKGGWTPTGATITVTKSSSHHFTMHCAGGNVTDADRPLLFMGYEASADM